MRAAFHYRHEPCSEETAENRLRLARFGRQKMVRAVRNFLPIIIIVLFVATAVAIFSLSTQRFGTNTAIDQMAAALDLAGGAAETVVMDSVDDVERASAIISDVAADPDSIAFEQTMRRTLDYLPEVSGVFIGDDDGAFLFVFRTDTGYGTKRVTPAQGATPRQVIFTDRDEHFGFVSSRLASEDTYDPRTREWFTNAQGVAASWTEPYIFFTSQTPGITRSQAVPGSPTGQVVGVDVELASLIAQLTNLSTRISGEVFLYDGADFVLSQHGLINLAEPATESDDRVRHAVEIHRADPDEANPGAYSQYRSNGQTHLVKFSSIGLGDTRWRVGVDVAASDTVMPVLSVTRAQQLLGLAVGAGLALSLALVLSPGIARAAIRRKEVDTQMTRVGRVLETSLNEILMFDAQTMQVSVANRGARENLGYSMSELVGLPPLTFLPTQTKESMAALIGPLRQGDVEVVQFETTHQRKDGTTYPVEANLQLFDAESPPVLVAIVRDISERKLITAELDQHRHHLEQLVEEGTRELRDANALLEREVAERRVLEEELTRQANHDRLTGLPNRHHLETHFPQALDSARRGDQLALVFMDLNGFKNINDTLGHSAGDQLLVEVAARLRGAVRESDLLVRLGGDEFALVIHGATPSTCNQVLKRITHAFDTSFVIDGHPFAVTVSIGVAFIADPTGYESDDACFLDVVRRADLAMYRSKEDGTEITFYDLAADQRVQEWAWTESALRDSIERDQLRLHYQPIYDLHSDAMVSAEALVRWDHPERGLIMPDRFIGIAEESGFIVELDRWALASATRHGARGAFGVNVNVAPRTLISPGFVDHIRLCLDCSGLDPARLSIELTEQALAHIETTRPVLEAIHDLGVAVMIDDFGTGYSSLTYLQHYPLSGIKLDQSFLPQLGEDPRTNAIVKTVIDLAHVLDLTVVAEGVESEQQLAWLEQAGCNTAQGFLLGLPSAIPDGATTPIGMRPAIRDERSQPAGHGGISAPPLPENPRHRQLASATLPRVPS